MAGIRFFSVRVKDVGKENPQSFGEPIRGLSMVSPMTLSNAIKPLVKIVPDIQANTEKALAFAANKSAPSGVAKDGVAAVHLLTQECESDSLYTLVNRRLRDTNRDSLQPFFPILKHLLTTLSPWPTADLPVWRGVDKDLSGAFRVGQTVLWWGFGSGTTDRNAMDHPAILGNNMERTLFKIQTVKGHLVGKYTTRNDPHEVLLAPGLFFEVTDVVDAGDGLTWIVVLKDTVPMMKAMDFPI